MEKDKRFFSSPVKIAIFVIILLVLLFVIAWAFIGNMSPTSADSLSMDKCIALALEHAGRSESDVKNIRAHHDYEDGISSYEVYFSDDNYKYSYTVDANTGKITEMDKERIKGEYALDNNAADDIGLDKAKSIALGDANLKEDQVSFTKTESDIDNGIHQYEIEFHTDKIKYDYTISASDGSILDKETDNFVQ